MHIKNELDTMVGRMLTDELRDEMYATHQKELELSDYQEHVVDFGTSEAALAEVLDEGQRELLDEMGALCGKNVDYALRYAFHQGVYTGFEALFVAEMGPRVVHERVLDRFGTAEGMKRIPDYSQRRSRINQIYEQLEGQLDQAARKHLGVIYDTWENRVYAVIRYAFYLGYRYALSVQKETASGHAGDELTARTLMIEHELALTFTWEEREWQGVLLPGVQKELSENQTSEPEELTEEELLEQAERYPLEALGLSTRVYKQLTRDGTHRIETVADLFRLSDEELLQVRNLGEGSLREIHEARRGFIRSML